MDRHGYQEAIGCSLCLLQKKYEKTRKNFFASLITAQLHFMHFCKEGRKTKGNSLADANTEKRLISSIIAFYQV